MSNAQLIKAKIESPLGPLLAIADEKSLHYLGFDEDKNSNADIVSGENTIVKSIARELNDYFDGKSFVFKTPIFLKGTDFQKTVWKNLQKILPGKTQSYLDLAKAVGNPKACRAVAQANGANQLVVIVPCHRVINSSGAIGGYSSGIARKKWLLEHEKKFS